MKDDRSTVIIAKTRKRCRRRREERPQTSSWSFRLCFLAAAAAIAAPSWAVVHGQTTDHPGHVPETTNVRGGRGGEGRGKSFVRQHRKEETTIDTHDNTQNGKDRNQDDQFLAWCRDSLGIEVGLVEIDYFDYPDYLRAMEDRIDIFCDDCYDEDEEEDNNINYNKDNSIQSDTTVGNDTEGGRTVDSHRKTTSRPSLDDSDRYLSVVEEYPPVSVRGLKASRHIGVGDVVLSIPHSALWTVHNVIDASGDRNLVDSMGPKARQTHGWESPGMDEIPLLAITLLYHMDLEQQQQQQQAKEPQHHRNNNNNLQHGPYLEILQAQTDNRKLEDTIPHLWSARKLRKSATDSVRTVAKGIRQDVVDLYESIVMVLIHHHPHVFGPPGAKHGNEKELDDDEEIILDDDADDDAPDVAEEDATAAAVAAALEEREWMFSLEKFHWAFALVNSRHWHLEIPDDPFAPPPPLEEDEEPTVAPVLAPNPLVETAHSPIHSSQTTTTQPPQPPLQEDEEPTVAPVETPSANANAANQYHGPIDYTQTQQPSAEIAAEDKDDHETFTDQEGPPAATPTDEWVVIQDQKLREEEERERNRNEEGKPHNATTDHASGAASPSNDVHPEEIIPLEATAAEEYWPPGNSFLAPLADLLNFGPPCTRGIYNPESMAFEIVATCEFRRGQEITFWYADACEDVFVANYGFTMPMMVPKCGSAPGGDAGRRDEDASSASGSSSSAQMEQQWQQQQQEQQVHYLEDELFHAYEELDRLDRRLDFLMNVLDDCHCGNQTELLAGLWEDEHTANGNDANANDGNSANAPASFPQEQGSGDSAKLPIPRSPSPPTTTTTTTTTSTSTSMAAAKMTKARGGPKPDAQHAIRNNKSSNKNNNNNSNNQQQRQQRQHGHRRHHRSMTRFRSRRHESRRYEF